MFGEGAFPSRGLAADVSSSVMNPPSTEFEAVASAKAAVVAGGLAMPWRRRQGRYHDRRGCLLAESIRIIDCRHVRAAALHQRHGRVHARRNVVVDSRFNRLVGAARRPAETARSVTGGQGREREIDFTHEVRQLGRIHVCWSFGATSPGDLICNGARSAEGAEAVPSAASSYDGSRSCPGMFRSAAAKPRSISSLVARASARQFIGIAIGAAAALSTASPMAAGASGCPSLR